MRHLLPQVPIGVTLFAGLLCMAPAAAQEVANLTRLPTYPNLLRAELDPRLTIEALGHPCARLVTSTDDSLNSVEYWYRRTLFHASETDLLSDERFGRYGALSGIKLALGVDYVAIFKVAGQPTTIELHRCSWF